MPFRLSDAPLWLKINLRLSSVKLASWLIRLSPFKLFTIKILSVPLGVWFFLSKKRNWADLAGLSRLVGLPRPLRAVPRFFFREAENHIWLIALTENAGTISKYIAFDDLKELRSEVDDGRGAILLGAHCGPAIFARLLIEEGIKARPVVSHRRMRWSRTDVRYCLPFLKTKRLEFLLEGSEAFVPRGSERDIVRHVKNGGAVFMMMDIPAHYIGGEKMNFLGFDFRFNIFAFKLALKHNVPVFFSFLTKRDGGGFRLSMRRCDGFASPGEGLRMYVRELEPLIKEDPFEWAAAQRFRKWVKEMK